MRFATVWQASPTNCREARTFIAVAVKANKAAIDKKGGPLAEEPREMATLGTISLENTWYKDVENAWQEITRLVSTS